jgi:hypothetical protein
MARPPNDGPVRLFTVEEANELLPRIRRILSQLQEGRQKLLEAQQGLAERFHGGPRANGHAAPNSEMARLMTASENAQSQISAAVAGIQELGGELKDPERGMVDFRSERDGRVVYLCWLMEEPSVMYWHELDGGYRGRQRLEG